MTPCSNRKVLRLYRLATKLFRPTMSTTLVVWSAPAVLPTTSGVLPSRRTPAAATINRLFNIPTPLIVLGGTLARLTGAVQRLGPKSGRLITERGDFQTR